MYGREVLIVLFVTLTCIWVHEVQSKCDDLNGGCTATETYIQDAGDDALLHATGACETDKDCKNGAKCEGGDGQEVCRCLNGTSGAQCENVDECLKNPNKCGTGVDVKCVYSNYYKEAVCECSKRGTELDFDDFKCKECNCGKGLTCSFSGKGAKKCGCEPGSADKLGTCEECDCGQWSEDCRFSRSGKHLCTCMNGFAQIGDTCKDCDCGLNGRCYFNGTEKVCDCNTKYQLLDGYCQECFCGFEGTCRFNEKGIKQCSCSKGFSRKNQECVPCNCGLKDAECFFGNGGKRCVCPDGFQDNNGFCEDRDECDEQPSVCPSTTKCENKKGTFACSCKDGYKIRTENSDPRIDGCEDINECAANPLICRSTLEVCVNLQGGYKCVCEEGYKPTKDGFCTVYSTGRTEDVSGNWRTGFIVIVSLIAGAVAAIFIVGFIIRRRQTSSSMESIQVRNFR